MKRYNAYKDSNFPWINDIPTKWSVAFLNHVVEFIMGQAPHSDSYNMDGDGEIFIKTGDFGELRPTIKWYTTTPLVYASDKDVFICVVGATSGKVNLGVNGTISRSIAALRPKDRLLQKYLYYYLSYNYQKLNDTAQGSAQGIINKTILSNIKIPIPPIEEQSLIVRYIDHKLNIIDEVIKQKEKLIELLKEKKQSIINETVTKGLNPIAKMKDSGIEWLGEIPGNWNIVSLRYLGKCQNGISQSGDYFGSGDPFVTYSDVYKNATLPIHVTGLAKSSDLDKENYSVQEGDVFFTRTSETIEEIGLSSTCLVTIENAVFAGFLIRFRPYKNLLFKGYSKYFFRSLIPRVHFVKEMNLVTRASLSQELLKSLPVCLPDLSEQKEIALFLDKKVGQIVEIVWRIEDATEKLIEYRKSIISEAVTGKIDVRECYPNKQQVV